MNQAGYVLVHVFSNMQSSTVPESYLYVSLSLVGKYRIVKSAPFPVRATPPGLVVVPSPTGKWLAVANFESKSKVVQFQIISPCSASWRIPLKSYNITWSNYNQPSLAANAVNSGSYGLRWLDDSTITSLEFGSTYDYMVWKINNADPTQSAAPTIIKSYYTNFGGYFQVPQTSSSAYSLALERLTVTGVPGGFISMASSLPAYSLSVEKLAAQTTDNSATVIIQFGGLTGKVPSPAPSSRVTSSFGSSNRCSCTFVAEPKLPEKQPPPVTTNCGIGCHPQNETQTATSSCGFLWLSTSYTCKVWSPAHELTCIAATGFSNNEDTDSSLIEVSGGSSLSSSHALVGASLIVMLSLGHLL
jgi:hypothetical protein